MNHLNNRDLMEPAQRLARGAAVQSDRFALADAPPHEAEEGFLEILARHRRTISLEAEFRAAERALAEEMNEENWARMQDLQRELQSERPAPGSEGGEEVIDGSGRVG